MYQRQQVKLDQINLSYLEWQPQSTANAVLMLHGMADNSLVWTKWEQCEKVR